MGISVIHLVAYYYMVHIRTYVYVTNSFDCILSPMLASSDALVMVLCPLNDILGPSNVATS